MLKEYLRRVSRIRSLFFLWLFVVGSACKPHRSITETSSRIDTQKAHLEKGIKKASIQKEYALKLGVSENRIQNDRLYQFIDDWYGVPYKYAGKDKMGIDCSGFTAELFATIYHKKIAPFSKAMYESAKKITTNSLKEGDLVFFKIESEQISHVGVYLQNWKFVHASTKKGVIISDLNEPYYKKYFYSAGRIE